jgi:hypothetical protein
MARIEIKDLEQDQTISREEMRKFIGGASYSTNFTQYTASGVKFNPGVNQAAPPAPYGCASTLLDFNS